MEIFMVYIDTKNINFWICLKFWLGTEKRLLYLYVLVFLQEFHGTRMISDKFSDGVSGVASGKIAPKLNASGRRGSKSGPKYWLPK